MMRKTNDSFAKGKPSRRDDAAPKKNFQKAASSKNTPKPYAKNESARPFAKPNRGPKPVKKEENDGTIRLNRCLANAGICSRREADVFIQAGVVTVNGQVVTELGTRVKHTDKVMFHNQLIQSEKKVYILLNKPKNTVTTVSDPRGRMTVIDLIRGAGVERVYPVGRLDRNTTGVLLLTNDGEMTEKLTHPRFEKKKIYQVSLDKPLAVEDFDKLKEGFHLEDGFIQADELEYVKDSKRMEVGIEIHSGRNRIVRRMFEHLGYTVEKLDRVYFAGLTKYNLPRGRWRFLTEAEINALKMGAFE